MKVVTLTPKKSELEEFVQSVLKEALETEGLRNLVIAWDTDDETSVRIAPENIQTMGHLINMLRLEYEAILWDVTHESDEETS